LLPKPAAEAGLVKACRATAAQQSTHRPGAAFVIKDVGQAPDAAVLTTLLRAITARLDGDGTTVKVTLHLFPFGQ